MGSFKVILIILLLIACLSYVCFQTIWQNDNVVSSGKIEPTNLINDPNVKMTEPGYAVDDQINHESEKKINSSYENVQDLRQHLAQSETEQMGHMKKFSGGMPFIDDLDLIPKDLVIPKGRKQMPYRVLPQISKTDLPRMSSSVDESQRMITDLPDWFGNI